MISWTDEAECGKKPNRLLTTAQRGPLYLLSYVNFLIYCFTNCLWLIKILSTCIICQAAIAWFTSARSYGGCSYHTGPYFYDLAKVDSAVDTILFGWELIRTITTSRIAFRS